MQQLKVEFVRLGVIECRPAPLIVDSSSAKVPDLPGQAMKMFKGCATLSLTLTEGFAENVNTTSTSGTFAKSRYRFAYAANLPTAGSTTDALGLR